jgi:hypothetical protein
MEEAVDKWFGLSRPSDYFRELDRDCVQREIFGN